MNAINLIRLQIIGECQWLILNSGEAAVFGTIVSLGLVPFPKTQHVKALLSARGYTHNRILTQQRAASK